MDPKKVLFFITKSNYGGAQRYVFDLASTLTRSHDVCVVSGGTGVPGEPPGLLSTKLHEARIRTHILPSLGRDISILNDVRSFFEFLHILSQEQPSIVHLNSSKAAGIGALATRIYNLTATSPAKIIFTAHGWPFWEPRSPIARVLMYTFSWLTSLLSHATICICEHDAKVARSMWGVASKTYVVYNGLPTLSFLSREEARSALSISTSLPVVGTIAELTKNKNVEGALAALTYLTSPVTYVVIGSGELHTHLAQQASTITASPVSLLGFKADAYQYLRAFDLFLLPSCKEGVPYVLLEAQAAGIPIAAAAVGGIPEILETYPHTLCTPTSTESIAKAITDGLLLHKPQPTHTYTIDRMCAETLQVYRS